MRANSDKPKNMRLDIELKNIGPHSDAHLVKNVSSINMAIFAENGSGKSFISKSFKRIAERKRLDEADAGSAQTLIKKSASMISFGEREGTLSFSLRPDSGMEVQSSIRFMPNSLPEVRESSDPFIFYVFNSEYVRENLEAVHYRPENKVSGFILGKVNIDLSKERQELSRLEEQGKALRARIEKAITDALSELRGLGVQQNTTEYKQITLDSVSRREKAAEKRQYEEVRSLYESFLALPEGIDDLPRIEEPDLSKLKDIAAEIQALLEGKFTLSYFEEAFKKEISPKQDFIQRGLELSDGARCPFCGQTYNDEAHNLIDRYTAFLEDEEASVLRRIQQAQEKLRRYSGQIALAIQKNASLVAKYNGLRKYFPSFSNDEWALIDVDISALSDAICAALDRKKSNIREAISESNLDSLKIAVETVAGIIQNNNSVAARLNSTKNNSTSERLLLRKALCTSKLNWLITTEDSNLEQLFQTRKAFSEQKRLIEEKESQARIDKKALVVSDLQRNLDRFFSGKYQFDPERFCITFKENALLDNTEEVLSDGEKSILALCYYFANVHAVLSKEKLREKGSLYSLIEDQSHGGWRESKGYTDETIIDACLGVVEFLKDEYPGQIQEAEAILDVR